LWSFVKVRFKRLEAAMAKVMLATQPSRRGRFVAGSPQVESGKAIFARQLTPGRRCM